MAQANPARPVLDSDILPALVEDLKDMVDGKHKDPPDPHEQLKFLRQLALDLAVALVEERHGRRVGPHRVAEDDTNAMNAG